MLKLSPNSHDICNEGDRLWLIYFMYISYEFTRHFDVHYRTVALLFFAIYYWSNIVSFILLRSARMFIIIVAIVVVCWIVGDTCFDVFILLIFLLHNLGIIIKFLRNTKPREWVLFLKSNLHLLLKVVIQE